MKNMLRVAACLMVFALASCAPSDANLILEGPDGSTVPFNAEFAYTDMERQQGLMGRTELAEDEGMLFVFEENQNLFFWMKNTLIPLDIIFFDRDGNFVSSTTMQPCPKNPFTGDFLYLL